MFKEKFILGSKDNSNSIKLADGSQVAVIGGGPAGSFFSYFFLDFAERIGLDVQIDVFEQQNFSRYGPAGCNHCAGVVSESLVQLLGTEGINIPPDVVQRGIDSYVLHMSVGSVSFETPLLEKKIATIFRGAGPLGTKEIKWRSFDGFLQEAAINKGANLVRERVVSINFDTNRPLVTNRGGSSKAYDLIVGAVGINATTVKLFKDLKFGYHPPQITKTFICEYLLGYETVQKYFGNSIHIFLLNIPRLKFAALIPKGNYVTICLLGEEIDKELVQCFLETLEVKQCFPPGWSPSQRRSCQCFPKINIKSAIKPFADRLVLIGDCAVTRLYKDGIGAAYFTAKAAAKTAIFRGISSEDFKQYYWPVCKSISTDNTIGKVIFAFTRQVQNKDFSKRGILRMVTKEQRKKNKHQPLSTVLWDTFTGSAPYRDIVMRTLNPLFLCTLTWETAVGFLPLKRSMKTERSSMKTSTLGKLYKDNEIIIKQGEVEDYMYIIQSGKVVVSQKKGEKEIRLAELGEGDFFGVLALFTRELRSATVRAQGDVVVLTVDKKTLLHRIQRDPTLAFRIIQNLSCHIYELNAKHSRIKAADRRDWDTRPDRKEDKD